MVTLCLTESSKELCRTDTGESLGGTVICLRGPGEEKAKNRPETRSLYSPQTVPVGYILHPARGRVLQTPLTQTGSGPGSLHLTPQLGPQVELLGLVDEVPALETAADERLEHSRGGRGPTSVTR